MKRYEAMSICGAVAVLAILGMGGLAEANHDVPTILWLRLANSNPEAPVWDRRTAVYDGQAACEKAGALTVSGFRVVKGKPVKISEVVCLPVGTFPRGRILDSAKDTQTESRASQETWRRALEEDQKATPKVPMHLWVRVTDSTRDELIWQQQPERFEGRATCQLAATSNKKASVFGEGESITVFRYNEAVCLPVGERPRGRVFAEVEKEKEQAAEAARAAKEAKEAAAEKERKAQEDRDNLTRKAIIALGGVSMSERDRGWLWVLTIQPGFPKGLWVRIEPHFEGIVYCRPVAEQLLRGEDNVRTTLLVRPQLDGFEPRDAKCLLTDDNPNRW